MRSVYNDQVIQNIDIYIHLQSLLFALDDGKFEECQIFLESSIFAEANLIPPMARQILLTIDYQPRSIISLVRFIKNFPFSDEAKQKNIEILVKTIFEIIVSSPRVSNSRLFFVYKCFKEDLIPVNEIIQKLKSIDTFFWFAQQFEELNPIKFNEFLALKDEYLFISSIDEMKKNNWNLFNQLASDGMNHNFIAKLIRSDDIEKIRNNFFCSDSNDFNELDQPKRMQNGKFNVNMRIPYSSFESIEILTNGCTLLQYSAYFNSLKCFLFFLNNGSSLFSTDHKGLTVVSFAIAGGSSEVLNEIFSKIAKSKFLNNDINNSNNEKGCLLEKDYPNENNSNDNERSVNTCFINENLYLQTILIGLSFAALFHQNNIFSYLEILIQREQDESVSNCPNDFKENINIYKSAFFSAVTSNNMKLVINIISKGIDINNENHCGETVLIIAASNGYIELVSYFLTLPNINVTHSDHFGRNALICAVDSHNLDIVKLLVNDGRININTSDVIHFYFGIFSNLKDIIQLFISQFAQMILI